MKLTRSEFQNYIHSYEQDEIFYRDLYFAEKEHPETFREYCQNLDREMIAQRKLYVPALRKDEFPVIYGKIKIVEKAHLRNEPGIIYF